MIILPEYQHLFDCTERQQFYIDIKDHGEEVFEIFENTYGIRPGDVMAEEHQYFHYMYSIGSTLEGTAVAPSSFMKYEEFISYCCPGADEADIELNVSLI